MRDTPTEALGGLLVLAYDLTAGVEPGPGMALFVLDKVATLTAALGLTGAEITRAADAQMAARSALYDIKEASRASPPA